eukprot:2443596-Rhodomonas_salina.1
MQPSSAAPLQPQDPHCWMPRSASRRRSLASSTARTATCSTGGRTKAQILECHNFDERSSVQRSKGAFASCCSSTPTHQCVRTVQHRAAPSSSLHTTSLPCIGPPHLLIAAPSECWCWLDAGGEGAGWDRVDKAEGERDREGAVSRRRSETARVRDRERRRGQS